MSETTIKICDTVKRVEDHPFSDMGEEVVMLNSTTGTFFGLGSTGTRIWEVIAEPISVEDVCTRLRQEFNVSSEVCQAQVSRFLGQLFEEGLIEVIHPV